MDELVKAARAILEDFDLYGQPISLRLLADLRRAVEAAQQSVQPTDGWLSQADDESNPPHHQRLTQSVRRRMK